MHVTSLFWLLLLSFCLLMKLETFLTVDKGCLLLIEFFSLLSAYNNNPFIINSLSTAAQDKVKV